MLSKIFLFVFLRAFLIVRVVFRQAELGIYTVLYHVLLAELGIYTVLHHVLLADLIYTVPLPRFAG